MGPEARLRKAFELSSFSRALFRAGLANRFPDLSESNVDRLMRDRIARCHNRIY